MIEVNEYVRTKNKGIRKIDRIDNNKTINKYLYFTGREDFEGKEYGIIKTNRLNRSWRLCKWKRSKTYCYV